MKTFLDNKVNDVQEFFNPTIHYPEESAYTAIKQNMRKWSEPSCTEAPLVSIIILSADNLNYLRPCLASIERFTLDIPVEIIIVSNGHKLVTKEYLDNCGYKVFYRQDDFDFSRYCNYGASKAEGKIYVFLNDDTVVTKGWLKAPTDVLLNDPNVGICGVKILSTNNKLAHMGIAVNQPGEYFTAHLFAGEDPDIPQANEYRNVGAVTGACLIISEEVFRIVQGFGEDFQGGYFEDFDLCLRADKAGYEVLYVPDAVIYHHEGISFAKVPDKAQVFHPAMLLFREKWIGLIENNSNRFTRPKFLYSKKRRRMIIRNSYMATAGGGETLTLNLAKTFKDDFQIEIQTARIDKKVFDKLSTIHDMDFYGIDFELMNPSKACDVFINSEFCSSFGGQQADLSIYYCMFPHAVSDIREGTFLGFYDQFVGISNYASEYIWEYWKRKSLTICPVTLPMHYTIGDSRYKQKVILSVGRFFTKGHRKNQDTLVKIFQRLNLKGWTLVLAGACSEDSEDINYVNTIQDYINRFGLNVQLRLNIPRKELEQLYKIASIYWHATGINSNYPIEKEHFGISLCEAISAGCIPLSYNGGGPTEILKGHPELLWSDLNELKEKTLMWVKDKEAGGPVDSFIYPLSQVPEKYNFELFKDSWRTLVFNNLT